MHAINTFLLTTIFTAWGYQMTLLELAAFITSVIGVGLSIFGTRSTWPWWNVSSLLYAIFFFEPLNKWYASGALQFIFIAGGIWGWFGWGKGGASPGKLKTKDLLICLGIYLGAWFALNPLLIHIGAAATLTDSFCFVGSCIAQYLMVKEKFEAWPLWFVVDSVYTYQYFHGKAYLTGILYLLFVLMAIAGWRRWLARANATLLTQATERESGMAKTK